MVDIHSHILSGLDDGAKTFEVSVGMLRMAAQAGTTAIVATPHANSEYEFDPAAIREQVAQLAAEVPEIHIYTGCDFHLSFENIQDAIAHPRKYTVNQKQYLLVEFPDAVAFATTPRIFEELRDAGMEPIVTHPERNAYLQHNPDDIIPWVREGAYVQVTAKSVIGEFGRRAEEIAHRLLKKGLVHFIASDAHDLKHRTTDLRPAFEVISAKYGRATAEQIFIHNPAAVVAGDELPHTEIAAPKKWWALWK